MGWWGSWFGDASGGGGGAPIIITNNVTTVAALRDRVIALIHALRPTMLAGDLFKHDYDESEADFRVRAKARANACLRTFQVRDEGVIGPPDIANCDVEAKFVRFVTVIAYPQGSRAGRQAARDRDDLMEYDANLVDQAIGLNGYGNFVGSSVPNATWVEGEITREREAGAGVDFLVFTQRMRYFRRRVP
jgi:hypothetical protein